MTIGTPIQLGNANGVASGSTFATTANSPAGNLIVVYCGSQTLNSQISSVTDSAGNTYSQAVQSAAGASVPCAAIFYSPGAKNLPNGGTITVNGATYRAVAISIPMSPQAAPVDKTGSLTNVGTNAPAAIPTGTLTQAAEIVLAMTQTVGSFVTFNGSAGFTENTDPAVTSGIGTEYQIVNATNSISYQPTWTTSLATAEAVASFMDAPIWGWEVPHFQPPGYGVRTASPRFLAALVRGIDGTDAPLAGIVCTYIVGQGAGVVSFPVNTVAQIDCWGGGQAGQGGPGSAGGAGAGFARKAAQTITAGTQYNFSLGAAGLTNAANGGDTWFSNTGSSPANATQGALANGGNSATTRIGDVTNAGGTGGTAATTTDGGGGGAANSLGGGKAGGNAPSGGGNGGGGGHGGGTAGNPGDGANNGGAGGNNLFGIGGGLGGSGNGGGATAPGAGGGGGGGGNNGGAGGNDYDNGGGGGGGGNNASAGVGGTPGGGAGGGPGSGFRGGYAVIRITYLGTDANRIIVTDSVGGAFTSVAFPNTGPSGPWLAVKGEAWAGAGGGGTGAAASSKAGGGGGGYSAKNRIFVNSAALAVSCGKGGAAQGNGQDTNVVSATVLLAKAGVGTSTTTGGAGGASGSGVGDTKNSGGQGGAGLAAAGDVGGGGGGAAGKDGVGTVGAAGTATQTTGAGGSGDNGSGGAGGLTAGATNTAGNPGTANALGGGGGSGSGGSSTAKLGGAGAYPGGGGGGGGGGATSNTGGAGANGQIILTQLVGYAEGWQIQPWQPPYLYAQDKATDAAILIGDSSGIHAPLIRWFNLGWEPNLPAPLPTWPRIKYTPQSRHSSGPIFFGGTEPSFKSESPLYVRPGRGYSAALRTWDDGITLPFVPPSTNPPTWAYDGQDLVYRRPNRVVALMPGYDGTPMFGFQPYGWEVQSFQPPHTKSERGLAPMPYLSLVDRPFSGWVNFGWEAYWSQPSRMRVERAGLLPSAFNVDTILLGWVNAGWEPVLHQPSHPRPERGGAILRGDDGIAASLLSWFNAGWGFQAFQPPHPRPERSGLLPFGMVPDAVLLGWLNAGWEVQAFQPPHTRSERGLVGLPYVSFIDALYARWFNAGWEVQAPTPPRLRYERAGVIQSISVIDAILQGWVNDGWEVQAFQPPHLRTEKVAALLRGIDGTDAPFISPPSFKNWTYELPYTMNRVRTERFAALIGGDDTREPFKTFYPMGWEVQAFQPSHPRPERYSAIQMFPLDVSSPVFVQYGWPVQPFQSPHPRFERAGSLMRGDDGNLATFFLTPQVITWALDQPAILPRYPSYRAGALVGGYQVDDIRHPWVNAGWEFQAFQPPHPRPERSGLLQVVTVPDAILAGWLNAGWEVQALQPPRLHNERAALMQVSTLPDDTFHPWVNAGWEVQSIQPPHLRSERAGLLPVGFNIDAVLNTYVPYGWQFDPPLLVPLRRVKGAALIYQEFVRNVAIVRLFTDPRFIVAMQALDRLLEHPGFQVAQSTDLDRTPTYH